MSGPADCDPVGYSPWGIAFAGALVAFIIFCGVMEVIK